MFRANLRFTIEDSAEPPSDFEIAASGDFTRDRDGESLVWEHLAAEFVKEAFPGNYFEALPDPTTLPLPPAQTFTAQEMTLNLYFDRRNSYWCWFAIRGTLIEARWLLAQARVCKSVEPAKSALDSGNRLLYGMHLDKMNYFDLATYKLAKVEDLFYRLIFENLGTTLVPIDLSRPNWEAQITRERLRRGLRLHSSRISELPFWSRLKHHVRSIWDRNLRNMRLEEMGQNEYRELMRIFNSFTNPNFVHVFSEYRNKLTHRNSPSVDYPDFYIDFENRIGQSFTTHTGNTGVSYSIGTRRTVPEYDFLQLYDSAAQTMGHYIQLLRDLQAIPRFTQ